MTPIVRSWKRTCIAMPSQWEGTLDDGRVFYGRFRFSNLTLGIAATYDDAVRDSRYVDGPRDHSGGWDGDMTNAAFQRWTAELLDWSQAPAVVDDTGWEES